MDVFLVGLGAASATDLRAHLEVEDFDGVLIRDWSSMTDDDTFWGVVADAPYERFLSGSGGHGFEVRGVMPLTVELSGDVVDVSGAVNDLLPGEPPAPLAPLVRAHLHGGGGENLIEGDGQICRQCGWIGGHSPKCPRH